MGKPRRLIGIDLLRILSAFVVFLYHTVIHLGSNYGIAMNFVRSGGMFMIAFYLISGASIYYNYNSVNIMEINEKVLYKKRYSAASSILLSRNFV